MSGAGEKRRAAETQATRAENESRRASLVARAKIKLVANGARTRASDSRVLSSGFLANAELLA